jgi:hypothetical protein
LKKKEKKEKKQAEKEEKLAKEKKEREDAEKRKRDEEALQKKPSYKVAAASNPFARKNSNTTSQADEMRHIEGKNAEEERNYHNKPKLM